MNLHMTTILLVGIAVSLGLYTGKLVRRAGLPSLIGYMLLGAVMGSSFLDIFSAEVLRGLGFITDIALGFVAFSIGSELNLTALRKLGRGITTILLFETMITFILVTASVLLITGDWPFALIFGAMAPATAPAGTVAVIQEYRAKGDLTQALYAVVGFDDGIAVLIFGFAAAISESLLAAETGGSSHILRTAGEPALEILASIATGLVLGIIYTKLVSVLRSHDDIPALTFGFVCLSVGLAITFGFSPILTPMAVGFTLTNTSMKETAIVAGRMRSLMPLVFVLFFFIAGTHLRIGTLHALGLVGITYIAARSLGKIVGAGLGARVGGASPVLRRYLGIGLLSQAGVAIGLAIATASHFGRLGEHGAGIATAVITTVTATSVVFEIIGPIMAKVALRKAGEIEA
jgi:Kef-type K+ transport system membrane component KefB